MTPNCHNCYLHGNVLQLLGRITNQILGVRVLIKTGRSKLPILEFYPLSLLIYPIKEFNGNTHKDTVVVNVLNPPITARYIRFRPVAWNSHISMRAELYGCHRGKRKLLFLIIQSTAVTPLSF